MDKAKMLFVFGAVFAVLTSEVLATSFRDYAVTYNGDPEIVNLKPTLRIDEAWLTINTTLHFPIYVFALNDECWKCPMVHATTIPPNSITTMKVNTTFGTKLELRHLITGYDAEDAICGFHKKFTESGDYWIFMNFEIYSSKACDIIMTNDPLPAEMPILYVLLGLFALAVIIEIVIYCGRKHGVKSGSLNITDPELISRHDLHMKGLRYEHTQSDPSNLENGGVQEKETKSSKKQRLKSLDTFRGLSLVIMMFVNYGGGGYWFFEHPPWNGLTVADLVFPWFIFIMGTAMNYSFKGMFRREVPKRKILWKIIKRSFLLFAIGIVLNTNWGLFFVHVKAVDLHNIRIPGVLQRFSLTYLVLGMMEFFFARKTDPYKDKRWAFIRDVVLYIPEWILALGFLAMYEALTLALPLKDCPTGYIGPGGLHGDGKYQNCTGGAAAYIDITVLGTNHIYGHPTPQKIYQTTSPHDPEGILGTLSSIFLCFLGLQAGRILIYHSGHPGRIIRWVIWAVITGVVGGVLCNFSQNDGWIPLNKNLWSVSFIMVTACFAFILLSALYIIIDVLQIWGGAPFIFPGMNSLVVYCCHDIFYRFFPVNWYMDNPPHWTLLLKAVWDTAIWVILAYILFRKRIFFAL